MSTSLKKFIPLLDKVVVEKLSHHLDSTVTKSGVILPPSKWNYTKVTTGKVVAVGGGRWTKAGKNVPVCVKVGDTVLLPDYPGTYLELYGKEYMIYDDDDLFGVVED